MKLRTAWLVLAAVVLALLATSSQASILAIGDPIEGGSWSQGFNETGVGPFNKMGVRMTSAGDAFESPVFSSFTDAGWSNTPIPWNIAINTATTQGLAEKASGSSTNVTFNIKFFGTTSNVLEFDFAAMMDNTVLEVAHAKWNGAGPWVITSGTWATPTSDLEGAAAVPEPATLIIWSLLGLTGAGLSMVRRRGGAVGRGPWPEESRIAIRQIIEQGHPQS